MRAEQLTEPVASHGECPVWYDGWGGLRWVDISAGDVLSLQPDYTVARLHVAPIATAIRPRRNNGMVVAGARGFLLVDAEGNEVIDLGELWDNTKIRMNDGACDPLGNFYCGSMSETSEEGVGALYRLAPDRSVVQIFDGVSCSNGLSWTPDGSTAFYVDTPTRRIDIFDFDAERGLHNRRLFVEVPAAHGYPDGLTLDAEGGVWVALWEGSAVQRYDAGGALVERIEVPTSLVTSCMFGGDDLDELYITTSRMRLLDGEEPFAGALYQVQPGVTGLPVATYAG